MASGVSLGESLAHNSALTELKVAHNSLADAGVQAVRPTFVGDRTFGVNRHVVPGLVVSLFLV